MDSFLCEVQCDEQYIPTDADWAEYANWIKANFENVDEYPEYIEQENSYVAEVIDDLPF